MTLVVARKLTDYHIEIVSDTRITDINATNRRSFLVGALKSVILSKPWCLCFAGDVKRAHYTIEKNCHGWDGKFPCYSLARLFVRYASGKQSRYGFYFVRVT